MMIVASAVLSGYHCTAETAQCLTFPFTEPLLPLTLEIERCFLFRNNHGRTACSISKWASFHMTKDTQKALAIIIASLGVLVGLLFWANHLRPHP